MNTLRELCSLVFLSLMMAGCSFGGSSTMTTLFVLSPSIPSSPQTPSTKTTHSILVRETVASGVLASQKILYGTDSGTRDYYQLASWTESPAKSITNAILKALDTSGLFTTVASNSSSALADYAINSRLLEFYHDTTVPPGKSIVEMRFELLNVQTSHIIQSKTIRKEISVKDFSAEGAVKGFTEALRQIIEETLIWMKENRR